MKVVLFRLNKSSKKSGFTLIEILVAMGILTALLASATPFTARVYRGFLVSSETRGFVFVLRRAESLAISNAGGVSHGVSWQSPNFVLFRGSSYSTRDDDFDEVYEVDGGVSVTSSPDIIFYPRSGLPSETGVWTFYNPVSSSSVSLNEIGSVSW